MANKPNPANGRFQLTAEPAILESWYEQAELEDVELSKLVRRVMNEYVKQKQEGRAKKAKRR